MSEAVIGKLNELLNEEKWTRATLAAFSSNNFKELDALLERGREENLEVEILEVCDAHLEHAGNSIVALYVSGLIALSRRIVDDSNLVILVNIFVDSEKWNIVEYLCERILEYGENKFALRTLADSYVNKNDSDKRFVVLDRLIKVDLEDADSAKALAEHRDEQGDAEGALEYYKKALHRYINRRQYSQIKDIWDTVIERQPEDLEGLLQIHAKVVNVLGGERAAALLEALYPHYKDTGAWEPAANILKKILAHDARNQAARNEIIDVYRQRYADHSHLEEYLELSHLGQTWRNVHEAIADFEKHISFDEGNYVFHRTFGLGRVKAIEEDQFTIDFLKKRGHKMSLKMAVSSLLILTAEHIWVLRATMAHDVLKAKVKEDHAWALRIVIKSFGNAADMKRVKAELVPRILTQGEWAKWSTNARRILKTDSQFGNVSDKLDQFSVRETPITFEEKTFNKFRAEKDFFKRLLALEDSLSLGEPDSEYLPEMVQYFTGFLRSDVGSAEHSIASYLIVARLSASHPHLDPGSGPTFVELFAEAQDVETLYAAIDGAGLGKELLQNIRSDLRNWPALYARVFTSSPSRGVIDALASAQEDAAVAALVRNIVGDYREHRVPFVWLVRNEADGGWLAGNGILREKVMIGMIHLLDITYRDVGNKRDPVINRKLNRQIHDFLLKEESLTEFLAEADLESTIRIFTLVEDVRELDPSIKIRIRQRVKERFPDYQFATDVEKDTVRRGLLVTRAGYEGKQKELRNIIEAEIPENSKEIGQALEKGDLRENAEYKAALERQEQLKNSVSRLQEDLQNAQIFDLSEATDGKISFGTRVALTNVETKDAEEYVILGPWESDPSRNIISYLSPLAAELWSHKRNDELRFTINDKEFHYKIEKIDKVDNFQPKQLVAAN
jgi:transcription elongation factor GreA